MIETIGSFVRRALNDERGQVLPWVALATVAILGMGGLSIDVGRAYALRSQLQLYANAAALAAAGEVYNTSTTNDAITIANQYSAAAGQKNANSSLGTVTTTVTTKCLNVLMPKNSTCSTGAPANAVQVTESGSLSTYFMRLFAVPNLSVSATATASMQGVAQPWNVAVILDATGSMSTTDTNCSGVSEFTCATNGLKTLLQDTNPCAFGAASCTVSTANFRVALFTFPGVSTSTAANLYTNCNTPAFMVYSLPLPTDTSYTPAVYSETNGYTTNKWTATYEVLTGASDADSNGFVSNYYDASASTGLNTNSSLVKAISGCMKPISQAGSGTGGLQGANYGGGITYYAATIYAAQAALLAEQKQYPKSKNAMILLSDGQANLFASTNDFPNETSPVSTTPAASGYSTLTGNGLYPDTKDECQQAIMAADAASNAGTTVYSVAYGSQQSGCIGSGGTDTTLVAKGTYNVPVSLSSLSPCITMENIASSLSTFYSDYNQSGSGSTCQDASHTVVSLADIFSSIAASFTNPRLLPNNSK